MSIFRTRRNWRNIGKWTAIIMIIVLLVTGIVACSNTASNSAKEIAQTMEAPIVEPEKAPEPEPVVPKEMERFDIEVINVEGQTFSTIGATKNIEVEVLMKGAMILPDGKLRKSVPMGRYYELASYEILGFDATSIEFLKVEPRGEDAFLHLRFWGKITQGTEEISFMLKQDIIACDCMLEGCEVCETSVEACFCCHYGSNESNKLSWEKPAYVYVAPKAPVKTPVKTAVEEKKPNQINGGGNSGGGGGGGDNTAEKIAESPINGGDSGSTEDNGAGQKPSSKDEEVKSEGDFEFTNNGEKVDDNKANDAVQNSGLNGGTATVESDIENNTEGSTPTGEATETVKETTSTPDPGKSNGTANNTEGSTPTGSSTETVTEGSISTGSSTETVTEGSTSTGSSTETVTEGSTSTGGSVQSDGEW